MNIIFAGTPDFAAHILAQLLHSPHTVKAIYTQPDRPKGRGQKLTPSPVKALALEHNLPILQPLSLRDEVAQRQLSTFEADLLIVVAYGLILPEAVLTIPKYGAINVHASLLPRWRGAAPIQRAILAGDAKTGVTIMQMEAGLDTGPMLAKRECAIGGIDTSETMHYSLAVLGTEVLLKTLADWGAVTPVPQDNAYATYAHKISKEEAKLDWQKPAIHLERMIRAFNPRPVAFTTYGEETIRIWEATLLHETPQANPGTLLQVSNEGIDVAANPGVLRIKKMQFPGEKILNAQEILNAKRALFKMPMAKFT